MKKVTDLPTLRILEGKLEQKVQELEAEKAEVKARIAEVMADEVYSRKALVEAMGRFYNAGSCAESITDEAFKFMKMSRDKGGDQYAVYKAIQNGINGYAAKNKVNLPGMTPRFALVHKGDLVTGYSSCGMSNYPDYSALRVSPGFEKISLLASNGCGVCPQCFHPGPWVYALIQLGAVIQAAALKVRGEMLLAEATKQAALPAPVEF